MKKSGAMYICGRPGCGKTAVVTDCVSQWRRKAKVVTVNCMGAGGLRDAFGQLLRALCPGAPVDKDCAANIERAISADPAGRRGQGSVLLVLDELDSAMGATGNIPEDDLRRLFGWVRRDGSRLAVVGIGNMLDLFNHRLAAIAGELEMLSFAPYTAADMRAILASRLSASTPVPPASFGYAAGPAECGDDSEAGTAPLGAGMANRRIRFDSAALDLCSRRVSAESGDVRRALQACRQAAGCAAEGGGGGADVYVVGVPAMARKLSELLAGQGAQRFGGVAALPLHQQLVLCTLARHAAASLPPLAPPALCALYARLCRRHGLTPIMGPDVTAVVDGLVDAGLVARGRGGAATLSAPLPQVTAALQSAAPLMAAILAAP
jgi:Cdc6-like AAA superfamily ATPase